MSIWNKVLIGLIIAASIAFFYIGARTLKTHQYWRDRAHILEDNIQKLEDANDELINADPEEGEVDENGDPVEPGIKRLRLELHKTLIDRGRVWYNCTKEQVGQDGQAAVKTDLPNPNLISTKTILFLFEEKDIKDKDAPDSGKYLGEFIVTDARERQVVMRPVRTMTPEDVARLSSSTGTWRMYDVMPIDVHSVFSTLDDDEKKKILPANTVDEYIKDGKPAQPDDPENRIAFFKDGKPANPDDPDAVRTYARLLRDYKILFEEYHRRRVILADKKTVNETDCRYVINARDDAQKQQAFREEEVRQRKADLVRIGQEDAAIRQLGSSLHARIRQLQLAIADLAKQNRAAAARIAKIQAEAAARINARTRAMAQSSGGS